MSLYTSHSNLQYELRFYHNSHYDLAVPYSICLSVISYGYLSRIVHVLLFVFYLIYSPCFILQPEKFLIEFSKGIMIARLCGAK